VFVAFVVAFLAGLVVGGTVPLMIILLGHGERFESAEAFKEAIETGIMQPAVLLSSGAATQVMLLLTAISAALLSPVPFVRRLRLNPSTLSALGYLIAPIGALAISFLFASLVALLGIHESGTLKLLGDAFKKLTPTQLVFAVCIVGIAPGFAEELLFRGYAQTRLVQRWGRWPGILITSLLFGIMHMDPLQSPFAFAFGVYLGYLAEKAGSIRPAMVCHAVNNSVQVFLGWYSGGGSKPTEEMSRPIAAVMAAAALAVVVLCTLYIRFFVHPPAPVDEPSPPSDPALLPSFPAPPPAIA
jgi:membrane protease YdiL (CAAX protease family)